MKQAYHYLSSNTKINNYINKIILRFQISWTIIPNDWNFFRKHNIYVEYFFLFIIVKEIFATLVPIIFTFETHFVFSWYFRG